MERLTVANYREDKFYPRVVRAVAELLREGDEVAPIEVFVQIGNLTRQDVDRWRRGQVPCLERVIQGNLSKIGRCLRIIGFHAHDLNMVPRKQVYSFFNRKGHPRFSLSGSLGVEGAYVTHYRWNQSLEKKMAMIERVLNG
ncbi:hypothetical protein [Endothiovibrio diazotrophicus]